MKSIRFDCRSFVIRLTLLCIFRFPMESSQNTTAINDLCQTTTSCIVDSFNTTCDRTSKSKECPRCLVISANSPIVYCLPDNNGVCFPSAATLCSNSTVMQSSKNQNHSTSPSFDGINDDSLDSESSSPLQSDIYPTTKVQDKTNIIQVALIGGSISFLIVICVVMSFCLYQRQREKWQQKKREKHFLDQDHFYSGENGLSTPSNYFRMVSIDHNGKKNNSNKMPSIEMSTSNYGDTNTSKAPKEIEMDTTLMQMELNTTLMEMEINNTLMEMEINNTLMEMEMNSTSKEYLELGRKSLWIDEAYFEKMQQHSMSQSRQIHLAKKLNSIQNGLEELPNDFRNTGDSISDSFCSLTEVASDISSDSSSSSIMYYKTHSKEFHI